jgi:ABC-type xylose transport system permease subunit
MFTKADIERYFNAEKSESLLFLAIGIAGIIAAIIFFFVIKTSFYKGAAIPLVLVGLLLGVVGFTVYKRSDADRTRNVYAYDMNPGDLKEKELPRMQTVMKNFVVYRYTEIFLALAGLVLFFYFKNNEAQQFWKGFGIGLCVMAILALTADYFAEKRGKAYIEGIKSFASK